MQRISPNAIAALKDALSAVFWFKRDLLAYLRAGVDDQKLLDGIDWLSPHVYKRDSVGRFVDRLAVNQERHGGRLLRLMSDLAAMEDFPQLKRLDDGDQKIAAATEAVARLRRYMQPYEATLVAEAVARQRIERERADADQRRATANALEDLRRRYYELFGMNDPQRRGYAFEPFLRALFDVFDLDPRAAFRVADEQIDGGFTLDGTHFLLEARWRKALATRPDVDAFRTKVDDKAENTLGLFISIAGFEASAIQHQSHRGSPLVLMDGGDVLAVLEQRIDLRELLRRKVAWPVAVRGHRGSPA